MRISLAASSVLLLALSLPLAGCDMETITGFFSGDCDAYASTYQSELAASGALLSSIPDTPDGFAMGLVLNQRAVNELFRRLGDTELPKLSSHPIDVLGQKLTLEVQPSIPTLAIGGNRYCPDCFSASIPFSVGAGFGSVSPGVGAGTLSVQLPFGMRPDNDDRTALVASFQSLEVTGISLNIQNPTIAAVVSTIEPIASMLLSQWLQTRFADARIATFDSWALGQGAVKLAGRGPFVHPETNSVVIAMQSNLPTQMSGSLDLQTQLPEGADIGFVFHPELLLAMTRRMHYEGVIPQTYDPAGQTLAEASSERLTNVTFQTMSSSDDGLLHTKATLYRTGNLCGTADLSASFGLLVEPGVFAFSLQDVAVTGGQGVGRLFDRDTWGTGALIDTLLSTLEFTINYDQIFGGETQSPTEMGTFQASIDARGIALYLNVLDI